jgi:hypothetical protein
MEPIEPILLLQLLLTVIAVGILVYIVNRYFWLKRYMDSQLDMIERVLTTCESVDFHDGIPVAAVERFLHYIKHPDPGFGPTAILRHERDNQKTKIGSAIKE